MPRPSHSTVAAYLALVVALSGTAYAAATIGSAQIKNNAVKSVDIKNKTLKVKDVSPKARAKIGALGVPARTVVVSASGSPTANGAKLRATLAALPSASAASPRAVVLGVGRYDADGVSGLTLPANVTLIGQGPDTYVEKSANNFAPVINLSTGSVVRDLTVVNGGTQVGARGIDGQTAGRNLIEGVRVHARTGILIRSSTLRDASIDATSEGLRIGPPAPTGEVVEVDNVLINVTGSGTVLGVSVNGHASLDGVEANVSSGAASTSVGLRFNTNASYTLDVRDSDFLAVGTVAGYGVEVAPTSGNPVLHFDSSRAQGIGGTSYGFRGTDGTSRIGSSMLGGVTDEVFESDAAVARCIDTHDVGYTNEVVC